MKTMQADVLIIGGGLAGLTQAAVLGEAGAEVIVVDREPPVSQLNENYDGRTTAISFASHRVLQAAGAWDAMRKDSEPILDIRVADGNAPLFLHFATDEDANGEPFGWIIENRLLRHFLFENLKRLDTVRHLAPVEIKEFFSEAGSAGVVLKDGRRLEAPLLIGADGRVSPTRKWLGIGIHEWSYKQNAIVCNVAHRHDHENVAVEHFMSAGPFAVLPMTRSETGEYRSSIVWTVEEKQSAHFLKLSPEKFDAELQKLFGEHLGDVHHVSKPMSYPLRLMHAKKYTGPRTALMAEAAHVIHPIAGQGLNLSMRDIAVLSEIIVDRLKLGLDIGAPAALQTYDRWRRTDTLLMAGFTDVLNRLFSNNLVSVAVMRDLGIGIVDKIPPLKGFFARQAMGLGGKAPRIVREGRL
ncbi:MAG: FAD-binding protein [Alphaproteobacteria bacterium]|nr:MAG: FAD-binding protein [Alphaproteobacteria bacterium]